MQICKAEIGDSIFLACGNKKDIEKFFHQQDKIANDLGLIDKDHLLFVDN